MWSMRGWTLLAVVATVVATVVGGCAGGGGSGAGPGPSSVSVPPEAFHLRPDGSVPWTDERITQHDLYGSPRAPRSPARGSRSCRAGQLTGRLDTWQRPNHGGETPRGRDAATGKLIGEVDVRNVGTEECTLRGEVPTRMLAGGREVPMHYEHGINEEARKRLVVVPVGGRVTLRLDWTGPFCQSIEGVRELVITLPDRGGTLHAPITATQTPPCVRGENVNPNAAATLSASGFSEPAEPPQAFDSPLHGVTVAVIGSATARAGQPLVYHVVVRNPTATPVPLDPCPGYIVELFAYGRPGIAALNTTQLYRLNCRPVREVPPGGEVRFEMVARVPAELASGRELFVTWKLRAPRFSQGERHWGQLKLTID